MTEPKYKPILFNAPMVRAILEGRKTQTRRIAKNLPAHLYGVKCPYGQPGDRLWVRENFMYEPAEYCWEASASIPYLDAEIIYQADLPYDTKGAGWTPSIHMPRWAKSKRKPPDCRDQGVSCHSDAVTSVIRLTRCLSQNTIAITSSRL